LKDQSSNDDVDHKAISAENVVKGDLFHAPQAKMWSVTSAILLT